MTPKRVLYLSQEIMPYLPETEISAISRKLPQLIQDYNTEVRIFMPRFGIINERRNQLHEVIRLSGINMIIDDNDYPLVIKVASIPSARIQVYFIDNDDFFKRKSIYGKSSDGTNDNDERSIFFIRGALETIKKLRWIPDVIHCHGVFTALTAIYLKRMYKDDPYLKKTKLIYTLYDEDKEALNMPESLFQKLKFDKIKGAHVSAFDGETTFEALSRMAMTYADAIAIGSETPDETLVQFAREQAAEGKPLLEYVGKELQPEKYNEFYEAVLAL